MRFLYHTLFFILMTLLSCNNKTDVVFSNNEPTNSPYPIITIDANINAWSITPTLYSSNLCHPDGRELPLTGIIRVDGQAYRFMGSGKLPDKMIGGMSSDVDWSGRYTFIQPDGGWTNTYYNDSQWDQGKAPYGTPQHFKVGTIWPSPSIWVRREITVDPMEIVGKKVYLKYSHDDELLIFINGIEVVKTGVEWKFDVTMELSDKVVGTWTDGKIVIAALCRNWEGAGFLDFGLYVQSNDNIKPRADKYTFSQPTNDWIGFDYKDDSWGTGFVPFGTKMDYQVNTEWGTGEIWVRRELLLTPEQMEQSLLINYSYDDELTLFVNGEQLVKTPYEWKFDQLVEIPEEIKNKVKDGQLLIAAHCKNKRGGAFLDFNLLTDRIARQKSVSVSATQTNYVFQCGKVELNVTFSAPLIADDVELFARPINYMAYNVASLDHATHDVEIYVESTPAWASNGTMNTNLSEIYERHNLLFVKTGREEQKIFNFRDQSIGIGWGYFHLCMEKSDQVKASLGDASSLRTEFVEKGRIKHCIQKGNLPSMCIVQAFGNINNASGKVMIGYNDVYSIQYLGQNLRPYWSKKGTVPIEELFGKANNEYSAIAAKCHNFDVGYQNSRIAASTYRQLIADNKLTEGMDFDLFIFNRHGTTGIINNLSLLPDVSTNWFKAQLEPLLRFCEHEIWQRNYPPPHLGSFPQANGSLDEIRNEIDEDLTADLLIALATTVQNEQTIAYLNKHRNLFSSWGNYLIQFVNNENHPSRTILPSDGMLEKQRKAMLGISSYRRIEKLLKHKHP